MNLTNQVAVVTGAGSGIGKACALALTSGCRTAPHAKDDAATETQLQPAGIDTTARPFDEHFYVVPPQDVHG